MNVFTTSLRQAANDYNVELTAEQLNSFDQYYQLLLEWNKKINLTAIIEPQEVAVKHIIDSLSCFSTDIFKKNATLVDVGTGAGFPGLPLKIFRPDLQLTLVDSLNKRLLFLQEVIQQLQIKSVQCVHCRAEDGGRQAALREVFDIAVSRAVARLTVLCELCLPFVRVGGTFIALKGAQFADEVNEAQAAIKICGGELAEIREVKLPGLADKRAVIYIRKVNKTPALYPRRAGLPEKMPILA